jgi:CHASE2 domain-containing sensor protein/FixJ family two-component response regulator
MNNTEIKTILIVDDDPDIREYLGELLKRKGFKTHLAAEGKEALEKIQGFHINIILCDIQMPGLNGIQFLKEIHKLHLNTQVIVMTGVYDIDNYNEAIKYETCGYLIKPFSQDELMKSILCAQRNILEKKETSEKALAQIKTGKTKYVIISIFKRITLSALFTLLISTVTLPLIYVFPLSRYLDYGIYDRLQRLENILKDPPRAVNDLVLVLIDDETLREIPQRWPYPRSVFAEAIVNLKKAGPRLIAFDFTFLGRSSPEDDSRLSGVLSRGSPVILSYGIDDKGSVNFYSSLETGSNVESGFANCLQDRDGITRRGLIYLKNTDNPENGFLSWEMQVLRIAKNIDLSTFADHRSFISFEDSMADKWLIPVDPHTSSYPIRMRAAKNDFRRLSFYRAARGLFDPDDIRDKIVLVGISAPLLGDSHTTSIGQLPGIFLKANAFLTLYTRDLLSSIPLKTQSYFVVLGLFPVAASFFFLKNWRRAIVAVIMLAAFFLASYILLVSGYTWNYSVFPGVVVSAYILLILVRRLP